MIELGADVNAGEEAELPICLAVLSGKKEMVELLLSKGATNPQKALELAREKKLDEIIGLLLAHIALEKSSEVVNMGGLELDRIKPTWILPSLGIYYSPPKRRVSGHRRNRSLGQMKELILQRRRSVDVLSLPNGSFEGFNKVEPETGDRSSGTDEPESGVHMRLNRTGMGVRDELTPPSRNSHKAKMRHHSAIELLPSKVKSPATAESHCIPVSHSSPVLARRPLDLSERHLASDRSSPQGGSEKDQPQTKFEYFESTPPPPSPPPSSRVRKTGVMGHPSLSSFEPTLSPIHGTPSHSLARRDKIRLPVDETDSGVEYGPTSPVDPNIKKLPSSQSADSLRSAATVENTSQILNSTPHLRRHRERKGTITGAQKLPFSNASEYLNRHRALTAKSVSESCPSSPDLPPIKGGKTRKEFSMSPTQFFNRFRKHRDKRRGRKVSNSVFYTPRSSSPIAIVYPREDCEASSNSDSNEFNFGKLLDRAVKSADELESSTIDDDAFAAPNSSLISGRVVRDDLSVVSQKLQRLRKISNTRHNQRRQSAGTRECSPSSASSSSVLTTPSASVSNSRRSSLDGSLIPPLNYRQTREEVDFGTYEAIPEESVTSEMSVMRTKLVKIVDLSSNSLRTLLDLTDQPGHEFVVQQMAEIRKLDLKQNQLSSLPKNLMKVMDITRMHTFVDDSLLNLVIC